MNIFLIAGSKSHAIEEVLTATKTEKKTESKILGKNFLVYLEYSIFNISVFFIFLKINFPN